MAPGYSWTWHLQFLMLGGRCLACRRQTDSKAGLSTSNTYREGVGLNAKKYGPFLFSHGLPGRLFDTALEATEWLLAVDDN
jgi:hypothetical protein